MAKPYQVAAIPVRFGSQGSIEVLLVTSRETRRWVVPKGWPWRGIDDHDAAAGEAWEEAGIKGKSRRKSIGSFTYPKLRNGKPQVLKVRTFLLEVKEEAEIWPEVAERKRKWFSVEKAAELVAEDELRELLLTLDELVGPRQGAAGKRK